jgi:hypothetical protein
MESVEGNPAPEKEVEGSAPASKVIIVNFSEGNYKVTNTTTNATFAFCVEAGGILTSDQVNGTV